MANQETGLPINDQTQAVLSKYGITAPRKITNIQNIQNKTETDIKIVQPDIKVTPPQININPVEQVAQRYRQWVSSAYDKQKQIADKQKEDLREKEYSLSKNINGLFRKIEELTSQIVDKGRKFKQKMDSSITPLVLLYISSILPIIWKPLMNRLNSLEKGFRYLFFGEIPSGESVDENSFSFVKSIRKFLGMDDKEKKGLFSGIGDVISEGIQKLIDYFRIQKDDRIAALTEAQKADPGWSNILDLKENFSKSFDYLGGLLIAAFGGSDSYQRRLNRQEAIKDISDDDDSIFKGPNYRKGKYINKALREKTPQATYYLSDQASKYLKVKDIKEYQKLQFLLSEIEKLSKEDEGVVVSKEFLDNFLGSTKVNKFIKSGDIKEILLDDTYSDYSMNSSQNGIYIGKGKYKKKAFQINNRVFKEIIGIEDFYSKEGSEQFYKYFDKKHKNFHKKEVIKGNKGSESIRILQERSKTKEKQLKEWRDSDKYQHFNNFGTVNSYPIFSTPSQKFSEIINQAKKDIGKITYKYGGKSYNNTDCSGYLSKLYNKFGITVPMGTVNIVEDANKGKKATWVDKTNDPKSVLRQGNYIPNWDKLRPGDIMVWSRYGSDFTEDRGKQGYAGHVSLYTGEVDDKGNPIILGNPGPEGAKGIQVENQDLKSYLGAIRYEPSMSNVPSTQIGDQIDGEKPVQPLFATITPTFTETKPTSFKENNSANKKTYAEKIEISSKTADKNNKEVESRQQEDILNNLATSLENIKTSISFKEVHAKNMTETT